MNGFDGKCHFLLNGVKKDKCGCKNSYKLRRTAFTLAEVLITLAVIGIVAVLTIPALTQNYKKKTTSARLKKFYSTMQQVIQLSEIENGQLNTWNFVKPSYDFDNNYDYDANQSKTRTFVNKYFRPYLKYTSIDEGSYIPATETDEKKVKEYTIYLADGSKILFSLGSCMDIIYDTNGENTPNRNGIDKYYFTMCFTENANLGFHPYLPGVVPTRNKALEKCKTTPIYCSTLLRYDNWEFKDDYPYKL